MFYNKILVKIDLLQCYITNYELINMLFYLHFLSKILLDSFSKDFVIIKKIQIYSLFTISVNNQISHIN